MFTEDGKELTKSPESYTKYFNTKSVGVFGYKGFKSTEGVLSVYGAAFTSIKSAIKRKAKRFF